MCKNSYLRVVSSANVPFACHSSVVRCDTDWTVGVRCESADCQAVNHVFTSKQRCGSVASRPEEYDVNAMAGLGMCCVYDAKRISLFCVKLCVCVRAYIRTSTCTETTMFLSSSFWRQASSTLALVRHLFEPFSQR